MSDDGTTVTHSAPGLPDFPYRLLPYGVVLGRGKTNPATYSLKASGDVASHMMDAPTGPALPEVWEQLDREIRDKAWGDWPRVSHAHMYRLHGGDLKDAAKASETVDSCNLPTPINRDP